MADTSNLMSVSVGPTGFVLDDYAYSESPIVDARRGRTGTEIELSGKGWVEGTSPTDLAAKMAAVATALGTSGQNWIVQGLGAQEIQILAATCTDGGPHCEFRFLENRDGVGGQRRVEFTVRATRALTEMENGAVVPAVAWRMKSQRRADYLWTNTIEGEMQGPGCDAYFRTKVWPKFEAWFAGGRWVQRSATTDVSMRDDQLTFALEFVELVTALPAGQGGVRAVDGEIIQSWARDEQNRLVQRWQFDLLCDGDPTKVLAAIRPPNVFILRESWSISTHQELRLRGEFEVLSSGDQTDLLNWEQTLEWEAEQYGIEALTYPGVSPVLLQAELQPQKVVQRGSATGAGRFPKPPDPLWPADLAEAPKYSVADDNAVEKRVTWNYVYLFAAVPAINAGLLAKLPRPAAPAFFNPPAATGGA